MRATTMVGMDVAALGAALGRPQARVAGEVVGPGELQPPDGEIGLECRYQLGGEGQLDRGAGLGPVARYLQPPAGAATMIDQVATEFELTEIGQPQ